MIRRDFFKTAVTVCLAASMEEYERFVGNKELMYGRKTTLKIHDDPVIELDFTIEPGSPRRHG